MQGLYLHIFNFLYVIMLIFVYFSKDRLKSYENSLFIKLIILTAIGNALHVLSIFTLSGIIDNNIINIFATKGYTFYLLLWDLYFSLYVYAISFGKQNPLAKIFKGISIILTIISE